MHQLQILLASLSLNVRLLSNVQLLKVWCWLLLVEPIVEPIVEEVLKKDSLDKFLLFLWSSLEHRSVEYLHRSERYPYDEIQQHQEQHDDHHHFPSFENQLYRIDHSLFSHQRKKKVYFGSLQFSGRPSSPMYWRTGFGSGFVLGKRRNDQIELQDFQGILFRFSFTFLLHTFMCFHTWFRCVFRLSFPITAKNRYEKWGGLSSWKNFEILFIGISFVFCTCEFVHLFFLKKFDIRMKSIIYESYSFFTIRSIKFFNSFGDFIVFLNYFFQSATGISSLLREAEMGLGGA